MNLHDEITRHNLAMDAAGMCADLVRERAALAQRWACLRRWERDALRRRIDRLAYRVERIAEILAPEVAR